MKKVLSIDLGGQSAKIAIVDSKANVTNNFVVETKLGDVVNNLKINIDKYFIDNNISWDDIMGIGFGTPGFVNNGTVVLSGNLGWKDYELKDELQSKFNKEVVVTNDANAAALGEYWVGAGEQHDNVVFYIVGTGVGGGVIINDQLITGAKGFAGELGHGGNFQNKYKCSCGLDNCIEPLSSAVGMEKLINEFADNNPSSIVGQRKIKENKFLKLKEVADLIIDGEEDITNVMSEACAPLAKHMSTLIFALNPDAIIIGGGPSNMGKPYIDIVKKEIDKNMLDFMDASYEIEIAKLKNSAGVYGNAWAILKKLNLI